MPGVARKVDVVVRLVGGKPRRIRGHRAGSLVGRDERGPLVDFPGNPHGPLAARSTVPLANVAAEPAAPRSVLLVFEEERSDRPVVVGLLDAQAEAPTPSVAPAPVAKPIDAVVDGRRIVLQANDEIELRCGEASITLRRNGRVVIRGAYVETRARGVNRVKGGSVQIN